MFRERGMAIACFLSLGLPHLVDGAESSPASLGIKVQSKDLADAHLMPQGAPSLKSRSCVVVSNVDSSGPSAGKLSEGNAIISIDGVPTPDVAAYEKALKGLKPDTEVTVKGLYLAATPLGEKKWVPGSVVVKVGISRLNERDVDSPPVAVAKDQPSGPIERPVTVHADDGPEGLSGVGQDGNSDTERQVVGEKPRDVAREECVTIRVGSTGDELILSPAGNVVATLDWIRSPKVTLWDTVSGKRLGASAADGSKLRALKFSSDGQIMLSVAHHDPKIRVWDTRTVTEQPSIAAAGGPPEVLVLSPDGKRLAFDGGSVITVYDIKAKKPVLSLRGHEKQSDVRDIAFSPDGKRIATASSDLTVRLWDAVTGKELRVLRDRSTADSVAFSRDGRTLAYRSGFTVTFWDVAKAAETLTASVREGGTLQFTADGKWLVVRPQRPVVLDTATGRERDGGAIGQKVMCSRVVVAPKSDTTAVALVGMLGEGGPRVTLLTNLAEELYSIQVVASSGFQPCPTLSDDGLICAYFSAPGEVQVVDVRAAVLRDRKAKEVSRALAAKEALEKAAREKTLADQRAQSEARAAADSKAKQENSQPRWSDYENLDVILAGFKEGPVTPFEQFVRYGTPDNAGKAIKGDRFDREEADGAAAGHRAALRKRCFFIQRQYRWLEDRVSEAEPDAVCLLIPLLFRCLMPANDLSVQVSACNEHDLWFLTKTGAIERCPNPVFAREVERNKGVLYVPELLDRCSLQIWFDGDREVKKRVAREPKKFVVNIGLTQLQVERPSTKGFFSVNQLRIRSFDTLSLLGSFNGGGPTAGPIEQPFYFVVESLKGLGEETIPEVATANLVRLEIVEATSEGRNVVYEREFGDE